MRVLYNTQKDKDDAIRYDWLLYTSNINKYDYERKDYEMNKENAQDNVDNIVYDLNSLYSAFLAAKKDSDWKPQVQKYEIDFLSDDNLTTVNIGGVDYADMICTNIWQEDGHTRFIIREMTEMEKMKRCIIEMSSLL